MLVALLGGFNGRLNLLQHLANSTVVGGFIDLGEVLGIKILPELLHVSLGSTLLQLKEVNGHVWRLVLGGPRHLPFRLMAFGGERVVFERVYLSASKLDLLIITQCWYAD